MNTYKVDLGERIVEYRCFVGNNKIVYLKAEIATYLELGRRLHAIYGCSVICVLGFSSIERDKNIINNFISRHRIVNAELLYLSHAQGCLDGLELANDIAFKKMLLINMQVDEKFDAIVAQLNAIPETKVVVIFADRVCSCEGVSLLKDKGLQNVEILISSGIYHGCKIVVDKLKELFQQK